MTRQAIFCGTTLLFGLAVWTGPAEARNPGLTPIRIPITSSVLVRSPAITGAAVARLPSFTGAAVPKGNVNAVLPKVNGLGKRLVNVGPAAGLGSNGLPGNAFSDAAKGDKSSSKSKSKRNKQDASTRNKNSIPPIVTPPLAAATLGFTPARQKIDALRDKLGLATLGEVQGAGASSGIPGSPAAGAGGQPGAGQLPQSPSDTNCGGPAMPAVKSPHGQVARRL